MSQIQGVYVGVENEGATAVFPARDYQASAFHTFMSNDNIDNIVEIKFKYPDDIIFKLRKFKQYGLQGDYSRFCVLVNQRGERHILSDNKALLSGYVGWKNRITSFGGSKRKSTKRKSTKRNPGVKHTFM